MNWTEHILEEIELHAFQVSEAVACLLHTILFVRAPGPLRPRETFCDSLNLSYSRCGVRDVDQKVEEAVEGLWHSLTPAGPDLLKGCVTLRFFERRIKRSMFGLMSNEEKVSWEQWRIPILVNNTKVSSAEREIRADGPGCSPLTVDERSSAPAVACRRLQELKERANEVICSRLEEIFVIVNARIDHVPPVMYEFDCQSSQQVEQRQQQQQSSIYNRVVQSPSPLAMEWPLH